ncbi:hypothetical protein [Azospirillum sp. TSO5]|uniref:hypothetical protein n=1 Tax=Azospirillum sp. TSO5 TaxID=716760 RepID=UPI000D61C38C|nr:hypothetical protein [Azospirillum sp. TSO5]PWC96912.1 hypothetical protein TSO5_05605 [Azospirillum sp. TSO5]
MSNFALLIEDQNGFLWEDPRVFDAFADAKDEAKLRVRRGNVPKGYDARIYRLSFVEEVTK